MSETTMRFTVGRQLPELEGVYDLEGCDTFEDIEGAVQDLIARTDDVETDVAETLQVLRLETTTEGDVLSYQPVLSGLVVQVLLAVQKLERKD
jgi:hypothetical protein